MTGLGFVPALPRVTRPRGPWAWGSGMLIQCSLLGQAGTTVVLGVRCSALMLMPMLTLTRARTGTGDQGRGCRDLVRGCHSCT